MLNPIVILDNGQIKETGNFKEGKKDGVFILFDESGIKKEIKHLNRCKIEWQ